MVVVSTGLGRPEKLLLQDHLTSPLASFPQHIMSTWRSSVSSNAIFSGVQTTDLRIYID
jgi:hypothetical protein